MTPSQLKLSSKLAAAVCLLAAIASCSLPALGAHQSPTQDDLDASAQLGLFPVTIDCMADEEPKPGHLVEYEPSCSNPSPVQPRIYAAMDHVPCFCKAPKVRNLSSGRCVTLAECPQ